MPRAQKTESSSLSTLRYRSNGGSNSPWLIVSDKTWLKLGWCVDDKVTRADDCDCANRENKERDRKSTRLNSSHGYISYAVFCLKKKKKNIVQSSIRDSSRVMCR